MKYAPHSNRKNLEIPGVRALRGEPVDTSRIPSLTAQMLSTGEVRIYRPRLAFALAAVVGVTALGAAVLLPRTARAVPIREIVKAASNYASWYEQTYRPGKSGKLQLVIENWTAPGKSAMVEREDGRLVCDERFNGNVQYQYLPAEGYQRLTPWGTEGFPLSTVEGFEQYKLLKVRREGNVLRYVFAIHQDLLVDLVTKLPVERDVYNQDGSILEIHKIFLSNQIDDKVFEGTIRPDVRLVDIPADRMAVDAKLSEPPQTAVVGGVSVSLYAVIVQDRQSFGAVLVGGKPHPLAAPEHMRIVGAPAPDSRNLFDFDPWPGEKKPLIVGGKLAHVERAGWLVMPSIPDQFKLRVPVWRSDSTFAGWAEFEVTDPIRTESIDEALPNFVEPGVMETGVAVTRKAKP